MTRASLIVVGATIAAALGPGLLLGCATTTPPAASVAPTATNRVAPAAKNPVAPPEPAEARPAAVEPLLDPISDGHVETALRDTGVPFRRDTGKDGTPVYILDNKGVRALLLLNPGQREQGLQTVHMWAGFKMGDDQQIDPEAINQWNYQTRFTRAYIDHELDPNVRSVLVVNGGVKLLALRRFIERFLLAATEFEKHIHRNTMPEAGRQGI